MHATITATFTSGLGDMYVGLYQVYFLQEELKKIGYSVNTIICMNTSPYKIYGEDREIFKRIFKFNLLDNVTITTTSEEAISNELKKNLIQAYKYQHIHTVFVDKLIDQINDIKHIKHSWYYRDDLPKINLLSEEVSSYCEIKSANKNINVGLHYRPFTSDNEDNIETDLNIYKTSIDNILKENINDIVFISTNKHLLKKYLLTSSHTNYYINPFVFPNVHDSIRELKINDEDLFLILKETLFDMYLLSKCSKIYRIANWFSAFLSFSCLYNQTNVPNTQRFYPSQSVIPL